VPTHPARRLWAALEALHDVTYFAPEVRSTGVAQGLKGFWMTYFAWRAAPLGPVPAAPVVAMFAGFHPGAVARALPEAWSRTTPQACLQARAAVSTAALRDAGADPEACGQAAALLAPVAAAADPTGRPLGAANAALDLPADPLGRLWQLATTLREHRGDGHIAALVTEGITGLQAHVLQSASGHMPQEVLRRARIGWTDDDWAGAADALRGRGLLTAGPGLALTPAGRTLLDSVEACTDERAWSGGLAALGKEGAEEVLTLLRPSVRAVAASGMLPEVNPTGLTVPG
jgi:helix-turn-helix protein